MDSKQNAQMILSIFLIDGTILPSVHDSHKSIHDELAKYNNNVFLYIVSASPVRGKKVPMSDLTLETNEA